MPAGRGSIMDPDLGRFPVVWAAAGMPTAVFPVPPATLRTLANATVAPITEERRAADVEAADLDGQPDLAERRGVTGPPHVRPSRATRRSPTRAGCARAGDGPAAARRPRSSP